MDLFVFKRNKIIVYIIIILRRFGGVENQRVRAYEVNKSVGLSKQIRRFWYIKT